MNTGTLEAIVTCSGVHSGVGSARKERARESCSAQPLRIAAASWQLKPAVLRPLMRTNGQPAAAVAGDHWVIQGDRGVTYTTTAPPADEIVAGACWPDDYDGPPLIAFAAEEAAEQVDRVAQAAKVVRVHRLAVVLGVGALPACQRMVVHEGAVVNSGLVGHWCCVEAQWAGGGDPGVRI
jgi:hypothetical protein